MRPLLELVPIDTPTSSQVTIPAGQTTSNTFVIADAVRVERLSGGGIFNDGGTVDVSQATDKEIIDALNNGTQITINPINDPPTISAAAADAVMARLQRINSLTSMTEGESNGV